jgi:hypothetical protein
LKVRNCATFTTDLPDDHIEDGPDIIQYGGKSVAEAISEILTRLGYVVDPPRYAEEDGWELDIQVGKLRLWCRISLIESYVMTLEEHSFLREILGRYNPRYLDALTKFAEELGRDSRFHDVLWFHNTEVLTDVKGSKTPLSGSGT